MIHDDSSGNWLISERAGDLNGGRILSCVLLYAHIVMFKDLSMFTSRGAKQNKTGSSGKRAINLTLSSDILEAAKNLDINISRVCDSHLREVVRSEQARKWREQHADFIQAYNNTMESEGLPLDEWKSF